MTTMQRTPLDYYLTGSRRTRAQEWYWRLKCGHIRLANITKCRRTKKDEITCLCKVCMTIQPIVCRAERL